MRWLVEQGVASKDGILGDSSKEEALDAASGDEYLGTLSPTL